MSETKFVKAVCSKTKRYFWLEVQQFDGRWLVVNVDDLPDESAEILATEVHQDTFETRDTLLACSRCGNRRVGGCACPPSQVNGHCSKKMKYNFECVYCSHCTIDYSMPDPEKVKRHQTASVTVQGKEVKAITFSNVKWKKFDKILLHKSGRLAGFKEPFVHVKAKGEDIEFHGYNISKMDEGVYYVIGENDDFEIECDVDTSTIEPHPGGYLYISFGIITAKIDLHGGTFLLDGEEVAWVGSNFKMRLSLTECGKYEIFIDDEKRGEKFVPVKKKTKIVFGFTHEEHYCDSLSHAYLKNIKMKQAVAKEQ